MQDDLRRRLRKLGVVKGVRQLKSLDQRPRVSIQDLVAGHFHTTSRGQCFVAETTFPLDHAHGNRPLSTFLNLSPQVIACIGGDNRLADVDLKQATFIDTETTGLSGGTGTMAFVVGLGLFTADGFTVQQYFLRDPGDEPAMIEALAEQLPRCSALVSFNGRTFDVPILKSRFILARTPPSFSQLPHLDLLPPARRLWRYHLPSCALSVLEPQVLGVHREQQDVAGGVIPFLYRDYLRTGDAREMKRVLYHNVIDLLSLATLAVRLSQVYTRPWDDPNLSSGELYGLARWFEAESRPAEAERALRQVLRARPKADLRTRALQTLGSLLKRADRRPEAFAYWQQLALESIEDVQPHVELAKYFEWHVENLPLATRWTESAIARAESWPEGDRRAVTLAALRHRLRRLERKQGS